MERKFLVLLRRFSLRKEQSYFNIFVCSFLRPHGETRRFLSAFGDSFKPLYLRPSSVLTQKADCAKHKQIILCLTHPPVRAQQSLPFLGNIIKRQGLAPLKQSKTISNFLATKFKNLQSEYEII